MDVVNYVFTKLGDVIGGVLQVIVDFFNVIIDALPNPDPFPAIIDSIGQQNASSFGFAGYWLDCSVGIDFASIVLTGWAALMIASAVFAVVYFVLKTVKP